mmetsp:Transcript_9261/g.10475  ORF Transcript_9261/g.10475 Transcript_9261/m.10475 type:complete len:97 (+) Transcript_9261:24-314(+)
MEDTLNTLISDNKVIVFSRSWCGFCSRVNSALEKLNTNPTVIDLESYPDGDDIASALKNKVGKTSVPQVFVSGEHVGGCDDTFAAIKDGSFQVLLD